MNNCFYISDDRPSRDLGTYVGEIDGNTAIDIPSFFNEIAKAFNFPDYFGSNYDALDECMNDLSWIDSTNFILYIKNYKAFLKSEDSKTRIYTLALFRDACNQWANVPNFEGEDNFRRKAIFRVVVERCPEIDNDLR